MITYTEGSVERLLRNYLDIRATLEGNTQKLHDTYTIPLKQQQQTNPFSIPRHAKPPRDGKAKARFLEELLCAVIDLEEAFPRLSPDDQELLLKYHISQGYTLDELMAERGVTSRGSMQLRIRRSVQRLVRELEYHE